jgi:hypothetical protein
VVPARGAPSRYLNDREAAPSTNADRRHPGRGIHRCPSEQDGTPSDGSSTHHHQFRKQATKEEP